MMAESLPLLLAASAAFLFLGGLLVWVVARLLRSNREQIVASGPLAAEQEFKVCEPGALLLIVEVPRFGANVRQFEFEVVEKATGQATKLSYDFVRAQGAVYGVNTMRVPLGRIKVERPGPYLVRIAGLQSDGGLLAESNHVLASLSWKNAAPDPRDRDLRDRHVA